MSKLVDPFDYVVEFELGEYVSFLHEGERLYGEVARVYNIREWYHVEVLGQRYMVNSTGDAMRREHR